jgi:hypothetical protein
MTSASPPLLLPPLRKITVGFAAPRGPEPLLPPKTALQMGSADHSKGPRPAGALGLRGARQPPAMILEAPPAGAP